MKSKKNPLIILLAVVVLFSGIFFFVEKPLKEFDPSGKLDIYLHLYSSPLKENLEALLDEFSSFYPSIDLEYHIEPYRDMKKSLEKKISGGESEENTLILSVLTGSDLSKYPLIEEQAKPWTGHSWGLYFNKIELERLGYSKERLNELSSLGLEPFILEMKKLTTENKSLFNLGANFYWPWLTWIQHLQILENGGLEPEGFSPDDWKTGIEKFNSMTERHLFNGDFEDSNWAGSLLSISEDRSLFVLADSTIYDVYHPSDRQQIVSIPFPGSLDQKWQIGSTYYLAVIEKGIKSEAVIKSAETLIKYLRSESVSNRFLQSTGVKLSDSPESDILKDIPSITQKVQDDEMQELLKYLK